MKVVCDIEANGLEAPDKVWLIVCKDIDTGEYHIFRNPSLNPKEKERFHAFAERVETWIGHNWLEYDYPVLHRLLSFHLDDPAQSSIDTLIISRMVDYSRPAGHSIEAYGTEFGFEKLSFHKFTDKELEDDSSELFKQLETYCQRDVDITERLYRSLSWYYNNTSQSDAINLEHSFQLVVNSLHDNGFSFNTDRAQRLLDKVHDQLVELDGKITNAFPARTKFIREWTPKATKHGTISKASLPRSIGSDLSGYAVDSPFSTFVWREFNPSSHKQLISVLVDAGWRPIDKTQTHIDNERELKRLKYSRERDAEFDLKLKVCEDKVQSLAISGWKINETNLGTLPPTAPTPARLLAKRILLESRRRTLTEWLSLVREDGRIHGRFYGIGAWTHRMAHQKPNVANIPNEFNTEDGSVKLLGKEMRSLWQAPRKRLLVGVDAEGIQLRVFAHYVNDPKLIDALVKGDKKLKTDPHSYNRGVLNGTDGSEVCRTRQAAKRFLYALFLGAGIERLAHILGSTRMEAEDALARLLTAYPGFAFLKQNVIPADARRGWFTGLDGRRVPIPGDTVGERKHLCMSGYLQNGESIIIKRAGVIAVPQLSALDSFLVNIVHDEYQVESPNDMRIALQVAKIFADAIVEAGEIYKLKCPMAGSFWNDDHGDYTIGTNWYQTH